MGTFDDRATTPRGPKEIFRWKVLDPLRGRGPSAQAPFTPPSTTPDLARIASRAPAITWIGHASFLVTLGRTHVLVDPVLGPNLGGFIRRFGRVGLPVEQLPEIDAVVVTHNHRDHLDVASLKQLGPKPTYVTPLGNAKFLRGAGARNIVELDWWQATRVGDLELTLTPARHWSMRTPLDRNDALWGGIHLKGPEGSAYHSGDTGYFDGFAEISARLGVPDWALLPIGAYAPRWFMEPQHMNPADAVRAFAQLKARTFVAMHWGTFRLTDEPLDEPPRLLLEEWQRAGLPNEQLWMLKIGETRALG